MPEAPGEYWKTTWEDRTHEGQHQRIATFITVLRNLLENPTHSWKGVQVLNVMV